MDFLNKLADGDKKEEAPPHQQQEGQPKPSGGGFMDKLGSFAGGSEQKPQGEQQQSGGGFMDKLNSMAGGGRDSEKNEDTLDKGVDWVQEHVMGEGDQSNETAVEQAKDEQISDYIRGQYKTRTGSDFPVQDKEH